MKNKEYNNFLLRTKDKRLLKFYYKEKVGIIYEELIENKIINKKIITKECLKYLYVFEDYNKNINLIYQDLIGNIILCALNSGNLKCSTIFYIKHKFITPINIKAISLKDIFFIFYTLDSDSTSIYLRNNINSQSSIIYKEKNDIDINYKVLYDKEYIYLIILSTSFNMLKIILKKYNIKSKNWFMDKIIFISNNSYIDASFCITNNKIHSLFIINEEGKKTLIYKYNSFKSSIYKQRELNIYDDENLSSCLLLELNNVIYLLWISKKNIYGCYSQDFGESFSKPVIYIENIDNCIRKIEFIDDGKFKEIYINDKNEKVTLFFEELLKYSYSFNIDYKEITYSIKDNSKILQLKK